jgi:hypothetical protein
VNDRYSKYLAGGMAGIGNDRAARIAYRALTTYMTSLTKYAGARDAFLNAATDIYGASSPEHSAVQNAFAAINVGMPYNDTTPPIVAFTSPTNGATLTGNVVLNVLAMDNNFTSKVEFYQGTQLLGTDTASPFSMNFNSAGVPDGTYTLTAKAYDSSGNVATTNLSVNTSNPMVNLISDGSFEQRNMMWSGADFQDGAPAAWHGSWKAVLGGGGNWETEVKQQVTIPATATSATLTFRYRIHTTVQDVLHPMQVQIRHAYNQYIKQYTPADATDTWTLETLNLKNYIGKTFWLAFWSRNQTTGSTTFYIDDVVLTYE